MKISFGSVENFRQECIDRGIHEIRRDYAAETKVAQSTNKHVGSVGITTFKLIVTATDGKDLLRLEHRFYSCLHMVVNEELTKEKVKELTEQIEEQLQKDFPPNYDWKDDPRNLDGSPYQFVLKRGVIEEV